MERDWTAAQGEGDAGRIEPAPARAFVLPSRARALAACEAALGTGGGFVLLTGEPGIGKTWLWRLLAERERGARRWLGIDPAQRAEDSEVDRDLAHALGLDATGPALMIRLAVAGHLEEESAEGRRWVAVIDEAQGLSDEQLEDVRLLSNRLGQPDGFAGMILAGQTRLARRLATHDLAPLEARLTARVHLRPIDADEAADLLEHEIPARAWSLAEVEALHRDAGGNPSRLLLLAGRRRSVLRQVRWLGEAPQPTRGPILAHSTSADAGRSFYHEPEMEIESAPELEPEREREPGPQFDLSADSQGTVDIVPARAEPLLGPGRPPIVEEEGLIEVGWMPPETTEESSDGRPGEATAPTTATGQRTTELAEPVEEALDDHYAALAAWDEWARNQDRRPAGSRDDRDLASGPILDDRPEEELRADGLPPGAGHVWAEGPDSFAPYSQLFSRLRPSKDPD